MVAAVARPRRASATAAALIAVLALAATLRLIGLRFGLPAVYNPDEVAIMSRALAFAKGDLNPHNFLYPTLYFYVLFVWIGLSFVVSWLTGAVASLAAFQTQFFVDPTPIYVAGRLLGVVCGTATVALAFVVGRRLAGQTAGLMAALFLAVAPGHVRDSHYVKHDVTATLAIVLAQLVILRLVEGAALAGADSAARNSRPGARGTSAREANHRSAAERSTAEGRVAARPSADAREAKILKLPPFLVAGAACGVACATHYYAVFLALPLLFAIYFAARAHGWRVVVTRAAQAGAAAALVFFALSPFLLVEPGTAWRDILANRQIVVDRAVTGQHALFGNLGVYVRMLWSEAIGWPVYLGALAGAVLLLRDRERWRMAVVLLAFPIAFLLFISNTVAASRYLNPVLPTCAWLAAYATVRLTGRIPVVPWLMAIGMSVPGLALSLQIDNFFRQPDTRTLAQQFIERTVPAGSTILVQPYSVPLTQSRESLVEALQAHLGDLRRTPPPPKFALRLALNPYPAPAYRTLFLGEGGMDQDKIYLSYRDANDASDANNAGGPAFGALRRAGVQYVVLKRYNVADPAVEPLRARLEREGRLLTTFSPYGAGADAATRARVAPFLHNTDTPYDPALERPGPGIEVWQVP
jgi:hypothetical protein